jgi:hypothetical protein
MAITLDGTNGITSPGGDVASVSLATPILKSSGSLTLQTNGSTTAVTVDTSQNVGIGTSSPSQKLVVSNAGAAGVEINPSTGNIFTFNRNTSVYTNMVLTADNAIFQTGGATERMRIDSSGNVGIGTSSPARLLHISGGASATYFQMSNNASGNTNGDGFQIAQDGANVDIINREAGYMGFDTNNTERMRITSSGLVYMNTTSQIDAGWLNIAWPGNSNIGIGFKSTYNGSFDVMRFFNYNGVQQGYITCNNSGSTTYNSGSDYRLKDNVKPMVNSLDKVIKLKPVTFNWKGDDSEGQGFIAHELQEIIPDVVNGEKDAVTEDGIIKPQGVDYGKLTAILTAAIQEQQVMIEELKAKVAALEAK